MMSLSGFLCLALGIGAVIAFDEPVDCRNCTFYNGLGYVKSEYYTAAYYVCIPFRNGYRVETQCCPINMTFDQEHLTCVRDKDMEGNMSTNRDWCPNSTFSDGPCPFYGEDRDDEFYSIETGEEFYCAPSTWWNQENCTCVHGPYEPYCSKIMHFEFENSYDSDSCNYIIDGTPHGETKLGGSLCLYGNGYVSVAFLNNWFAWNPIGRDFTFCARVYPRNDYFSGCIFSTNCDTTNQDSLLELGVVNGELFGILGSQTSEYLADIPYGVWSYVCVTYNRGHYTVCVDDVVVFADWRGNGMPINSQTESFIGMNEEYGGFDGYIDDVCFWTEAKSKAEIAAEHPFG